MLGRILGNIIILAILLVVLYYGIKLLSGSNFNLNNLNLSHLLGNQTYNLSYPTTVPQEVIIPQNQTVAYVLSLINSDRQGGNVSVVTYSNITSGQQHADSMFQFSYFSHWDPYDLKPYMRYTALGGNGAVDENVAYIYNSGGIDVLTALRQMEYNFINNDFVCCNNGHKYNIFDPNHNQVSIGVAYNATTVYLVEDFINNYISWVFNTPSYSAGDVSLKGEIPQGYALSTIEISYDNPLTYQSVAQLDNTSTYGFGSTIAGIGHSSGSFGYYFPNMTTVNASTYTVQGSNFDVEFNLNSLISQYGPGEYTVVIWLTNNTQSTENNCFTDSNGVQRCNAFIASTYTIFINNAEQAYTPQSI